MAQSLVCNDCGLQLKSVKEATDHNEATGHANFAESEEKVRAFVIKIHKPFKLPFQWEPLKLRHLIPRAVQVLNMSCEECGKPCRNKTQQDLHTKHTGHAKYVDKVTNAHSANTPLISISGHVGGCLRLKSTCANRSACVCYRRMR